MTKHKTEDYKISAVKYYLKNNKDDGYKKTCKIFDCKKSTLRDWVKRYKTSKNLTRKNRKPISYKPNKIWFDFLSKFTKYDIYVVIDDNSTNYKELYTNYKNINVIQIDNNNCVNSGFKCTSTVTLKKDVTGWDKAVYYFSYINNTYHNVWFFEEDVFLYNEKTLLDIDSKYIDGDLLSNKYGENLLGRNTDWVWHMINIKFPPPYYCAMVCGVRMSKPMLSAIKEYATTHKTLFFLEALFPSICKRHGLKYDTPDELHTVTHRNVFKDTDINTNNLFHPMKDLNKHIYFRTHL